MKYRIICLLAVLSLLFTAALTSCKDKGDDSEVKLCRVIFDSNGGTEIATKTVEYNTLVTSPETPKKAGYVFEGWYYGVRKWDFRNYTVEEDMTLVARWQLPDRYFTHTPAGDGTTAITGIKQKTEHIVIPEAIDGYKVTAIADRALKSVNEEDVFSLTIPAYITSVGSEALADNGDLEIIIEGELTYIGERAFYDCTGLASVRLAEGIQKIPVEAFSGCSSLKSVKLPKTVRIIEENAFEGCTSLQAVVLYTDIESIEDMAFSNAPLKMLYFYGTEDDVEALLSERLLGQNPEMKAAGVLLYSEAKPTGTTSYNGYWYINENGQTRKWN